MLHRPIVSLLPHTWNMSEIPIPIIILNWNGLEDTIECMTSILCIDNIPIEIILVDNGSKAEEQKSLTELYGQHPEINLVLNDKNKGFTLGNDDIVQQILRREEVPPYIALLNNDTVVVTDWIKSLVETAEEYKGDIISSKMVNYYDRRVIDNLGHFMLNTGEILPYGHRDKKENYNEVLENLGACGGAVLYRTSMIQEIGFFDLYFDTGYEDAELGLRAKLLGYNCIMDPKAVVYHKVSRSINKIRDDAYLQHIQTNIFYTYLKLMPRSFLLVNMVFVIAKYFMWFVFGVFTLQLKLIRLHTKTLYLFFKQDLKLAREGRSVFYGRFKKRIEQVDMSKLDIRFFFITDIKRLLFHINAR